MPHTLTARNAVGWSFALNGFGFASWVSRIPEARESLALSNGGLGLLLLALSLASVVALPSSGILVQRWGAAAVVRWSATCDVVGLVFVGFAASTLRSVPLTALGLMVYGVGVAVWDVAMNVEGAAVERHLGRTIMPRFHAGFSLGTVAGALLGAATVAGGVPMVAHLVGCGVLMLLGATRGARRFLPTTGAPQDPAAPVLSAWREPRTLLIGVMMLALALTEGSANDWLAVALIDGYGVAHWVGVAGFGVFVTAMTAGRLVGPALLDRHGRAPVLWATMAAAACGILLIVYGGHPALVVAGVVAWGVGASLGFPVGISAASDDPARAAARVSVVTSIAYTAFLAGPPFLGFVADRIGALDALLVIAALLVPSALVVPAARAPRP